MRYLIGKNWGTNFPNTGPYLLSNEVILIFMCFLSSFHSTHWTELWKSSQTINPYPFAYKFTRFKWGCDWLRLNSRHTPSRKSSTRLYSSSYFKARLLSSRTSVAMVRPRVYSYPAVIATSFISVCRALDLIFVVLVLTTFPTIYGGISKLICATGRVVCSAAIHYMHRVCRRNKFPVPA